MKKLAEYFKKNSYRYSQVARTDKAAIYQVRDGGRLVGHEVIRVRVRKSNPNWFKADCPPTEVISEVYPSNEDFGKYGWFYKEAPNAGKKYGELNERPKK